MSRNLAITISKGGVGKTTTAVNLSHALARAGRRILLVDTDTQGQVTRSLGISPPKTLFDFYEGNNEAIFEARENLYVLAGGDDIRKFKRDIERADYQGEKVLSKTLAPLNDFFSYIIVDTEPSWSPLSFNVLTFADELICPVQLEVLSVDGLALFLNRAISVLNDSGGDLSYIIPTMHDARLAQTEEILAQLKGAYGERLTHPIRQNVRLSEAPAHGKTIFEYAPTSRGAEDYGRLAKRVIADE